LPILENRCAFPRCTATLFEGTAGVGKICHIKAANPGGPRYDAQQTAAERHGYDNLILLCGRHHDVIDDDEEAYTVGRLRKMKIEHEQRAASIDDAVIDRAAQFLIDQLLIDQSVTSVNQSGGLTAHTVNYYLPTGVSPAHDPQVETLRKLVRHLGDARYWFQHAVRRGRFEGDPSMDECRRQCVEALASAQEVLANERIFIPRDLVDECEGFFKLLSQGLTDFDCARDPRTPNGPPRSVFWDNATNAAFETLPTGLERIETAARNLVKPSSLIPDTGQQVDANASALTDEDIETLEAMTVRPLLTGRTVFPKEVAEILEIHPERARHIMEKLEAQGLLFAAHNYKKGTSWGVSSNGRAELVKRHLL
jgi:hypothetical protein